MEQYIIVKVRDPKSRFPEKPVYANGKLQAWPDTNMAKIRMAIHETSEEQFISCADMVTHSPFMTSDESETIARIFNAAMDRAKRFPQSK